MLPPRVGPALQGPITFDQRWCDLAYLHWPVDAAAVAGFMPPGVEPDLLDGVTYVGLIPFQMRHAKVGRVIPAPFFGSFGEVNVRLYSIDADGRQGVVFRSLDANRAAVVGVARALNVPYRYARIRADAYPSTRHDPFPALPVGTLRRFQVQRHHLRNDAPAATSDIVIRVGPQTEPTRAEVFLSARWGMHSQFRDRAVWVPNQHGEWPLHTAELLHLDDCLVDAAGVTPTGPMLRPLWSPGVHARFGPPTFLHSR